MGDGNGFLRDLVKDLDRLSAGKEQTLSQVMQTLMTKRGIQNEMMGFLESEFRKNFTRKGKLMAGYLSNVVFSELQHEGVGGFCLQKQTANGEMERFTSKLPK